MSEPKGFCQLLRRAQSGNSAAQGDLLLQLRPCVVQVCRETGVPGGADLSTSDLVQEVWLRVLEKLGQFQGAEDDQPAAAMFYNWVRVTARGVVLNLHDARDAQRRKPPGRGVRLDLPGDDDTSAPGGDVLPAAGEGTPSEIVMAAEEAQRTRDAIDGLNNLDREIIRGQFFRGESLRAISEQLGISYDKARDRFHSALAELEHLLSID